MAELNPIRDERGKFVEGSVASPGRSPSVWQEYGPRSEHFLQTLTTSQILGIADDPKKLDKYSSFDSIVIKQLANILRSDKKIDGKNFAAQERERLLDRRLGKPKQALTGGDEDDKPLIPDKIEIVLRRAE